MVAWIGDAEEGESGQPAEEASSTLRDPVTKALGRTDTAFRNGQNVLAAFQNK